MVSSTFVACEPLAYLFPTGYGKQSSGKLTSLYEDKSEADLIFAPQYMIGYDTVMMSLPKDVLNDFLDYVEECFVRTEPVLRPIELTLTNIPNRATTRHFEWSQTRYS